MDPLTVLSLISTSVQVAGTVKELLDKGGVTQQSLQTAAPQVVPQLARLGASRSKVHEMQARRCLGNFRSKCDEMAPGGTEQAPHTKSQSGSRRHLWAGNARGSRGRAEKAGYPG